MHAPIRMAIMDVSPIVPAVLPITICKIFTLPFSFTRASGVGIKLAQRIVLELKDKVGALASDNGLAEVVSVGNATKNTNASEAIEALTSLGYTQSEAAMAVGKHDPALSPEELIKLALKSLARGL